MSAVEKLRAAGFTVRLTARARLGISPVSGLSVDQRAWLAGHRDTLLAELRAEAANAPAHDSDTWRARVVTCGACAHFERQSGHRHVGTCTVAALRSPIGWDTAARTCESFTTEPDPFMRECRRCTHDRPSPVNPAGGLASCAAGVIGLRVPPRRTRCTAYRERSA